MNTRLIDDSSDFDLHDQFSLENTQHTPFPEANHPLISSEESDNGSSLLKDRQKINLKTEDQRIIYVNEDISSENPSKNSRRQKFRSNEVHTTKYSFLTFIPKSLFVQFRRVANLYFLLIALLQLTTNFSPTGKISTIVPLTIVITFSILKDAYEDFKRRKGDWEVNHRSAEVYRDGSWVKIHWKKVRTGDIIRVKDKEKFPCDIIVLSSNDSLGLCYIETSQLDGETNYKIRRAHHETLRYSDEISLSSFSSIVRCDKPNKDLYKFNGSLEIFNHLPIDHDATRHAPFSHKISLNSNQMLLRGSSLRNTHWIIGIAIYTGHETKLMKNQNKAPHKTSKVERMANRFIFFILGLLLILVLISTIGRVVELKRNAKYMWYLPIFGDASFGFFKLLLELLEGFITFLILYNNLVPISLYVSMEVAKFIQGNLMSNDIQMYYEEADIPCTVRNSSLNEELGQVEYIFSDKTGTLTQNKMEFLKFSVDGQVYGSGTTEIERSNALRNGIEIPDDRPLSYDPSSDFRFYDERISNANWAHQENAAKIEEFFVLLAVCHTVIPERIKKTGKLNYQASSPDEAALVSAAAKLGVEFLHRTPTELTISVLGTKYTYKTLNILEFTSKRKRSSVIVRHPDNRIILYTKGADNVIYPLLLESFKEEAKSTESILNNFADAGLRTLVCAKAILNEESYQVWNKRFEEASCLIVGREEKLEEISDEIEKNLELVGVTAIEDELQKGVPESISLLSKSGVKLWVLTGDKKNTAINIGFACGVLYNDMAIIDLKGKSVRKVSENLDKNLRVAFEEENKEFLGLVVEGQTLTIILDDPFLKKQFLKLACKCKSVICCRVSPSQKADIVLLVKRGRNKITLAIGDGANDVPMIQAAHIGIGIAGEEGLQAANSADISIGRFRFLKRLLLVHGRWSYRRISKLVLYSFYKNTVLYLTQLWFVFFNWWSGTSIHDRWTVSTYNTLFTALPIMALAIFDRDVSPEIAEKYPELYVQGKKDTFFSATIFIGWLLNALWHSAVCFIIPVYANYYGVFSIGSLSGQTMDMLGTGTMMYTAVLFTVTLKCILETSSFTLIHIISIILSILLWFSFVFSYGWIWFMFQSYLFPFEEAYDFAGQYRIVFTANFWLTTIITAVIANLRDMAWKFFKRLGTKTLYYEVQKASKDKSRDDVMKYYQMDSFPLIPNQIQIEYKQVKRFIGDITGLRRYRGFAFSQSPNQAQLVGEDHSSGEEDY